MENVNKKLVERNFSQLRPVNLLRNRLSQWHFSRSWEIRKHKHKIHYIYASFDCCSSIEVRGIFLNISKALDRVLHEGRSSRPEVFCKKVVLRNFAKFTGKQLCQRPQAYIFIKKETLAQVFSCEFCKISKNTFLCRTPLVAASDMLLWEHLFYVLLSCLIKILTCASNK